MRYPASGNKETLVERLKDWMCGKDHKHERGRRANRDAAGNLIGQGARHLREDVRKPRRLFLRSAIQVLTADGSSRLLVPLDKTEYDAGYHADKAPSYTQEMVRSLDFPFIDMHSFTHARTCLLFFFRAAAWTACAAACP